MVGLLKACAGTALAGLFLATASYGQVRPDARTMTCAEVQALLDRQGAAVITTGQYTFDRYVSGSASCDYTAIAEIDSIVTRDTNQCQVHTCRRRVRNND